MIRLRAGRHRVSVATVVAAAFSAAQLVVPASGAGTASSTPPAPSAAAPAAAALGRWGPLLDWPIIPIHAVMTPDGRLLTFGTDTAGRQTGYLVYDVYDPATGRHETLPNHTDTDIFCATQTIVPSTGQILISGGDQFTHNPLSQRPTLNHGNAATTLFDPATDELSALAPMRYARWYATQVVLPDGRILVVGGTDHTGADPVEVPELWDPATRAWATLPGAAIPTDDWFYPRLFVLSDGRVFGLGTNGMWVLDPNASRRDPQAFWRLQRGSLTDFGSVTGPGGSRRNTGIWSTAVMFAPDRILQLGGSSNEATIIDVRSGRPVLTPTGRVPGIRNWANSTLLPDGTVLVTGGSTQPDNERGGDPGTVFRAPARWSPDTGRWTLQAREDQPRLYHSTALLLPDGTVMSGGGGAYTLDDATLVAAPAHLDAQVFSPPYLSLGARPVLTGSPAAVEPGQLFTVGVLATHRIQSVVLVKLPSVTHSFNNEQRRVELAIMSRSDGSLTVRAPATTADATPGYYYLFALDDRGAPSRARIVAFATTPGTG